ncbi:hypothetical protein CWC16_04770 [Pseudoalteromonas sp. S3776]|uniref:hypothetical protein n=1 Tax=unclassified Pseudoalteromonas TaxID=194690 RepID=UPI001108AF54|nr:MULTISPECIES: hypothetical protein [unclassified Pseudoalteromonas]TMO72683.1 hypothetical protein CWC17_13495 [Pseudoalteromonas sp. S3785]TMO81044.1 hypothetical protein CWC16_04770 [Pseudoalteromonas sp. S3776]
MFNVRVFITAFLLFCALFSVQSSAQCATHKLNTATSSLSMLADSVDLAKTLPISKSVKGNEHKRTHQTGFDAHQPRLTASNSSLFLHAAQSEPEYDVVFEFFAQRLVRQIFIRPQAVNAIQPWYTLVYHSKKSRLSGWKDANLLYRAVTTYHA